MTVLTGPRAVLTAALAAVMFLASCGGGSGPTVGRLEKPRTLNAADYRATGIPRSFGDTKPHEWDSIRPDRYPIHGIDAARYQGDINFFAARNAGINFAWLKATEGGDYLDPGFPRNAPRARAAGVAVGAYHFYYFCRTAREQARWFIENVPRVPGDLPPVLDMEWNHQSRTCKRRPDAATVRDDIRTFSSIVAQHYGTAPVVYTTPDFYEHNQLGLLRGTEFWLRSVAGHPSERYPQERWTFWQYTGTGVVPGIDGIVDINAFAGDPVSWRAWLSVRRQK
ncbi:GH25 family lysozyme [Maritimibacter alkaliphilus]|uniref:GH25 family lysozyme n=1 Tax=Maritimibacter alkaliphilus TaxID=404236 RepID=UPI0021BDD947|nr:GH25 family lysozyme [Maritimibacter alkaliphilus]